MTNGASAALFAVVPIAVTARLIKEIAPTSKQIKQSKGLLQQTSDMNRRKDLFGV